MNKQQITKKLRELGAAWATTSDKYLCTDYQCCNHLNGDKPAYHIHPNSSYPHVNNIFRFTSLREIAEWIREDREMIKEEAES